MRWPFWLSLAVAGWGVVDGVVGRIPGWPEALGFVALVAGLTIAASRLRSQGFVKAVCHGRADSGAVALTFDDGPDPATTPAVLDLLAEHGAHATFFVIGEKALAHPDLLRRMRERGHEVATHGFRHDWRALLTPDRALSQVQRGLDSVLGALGTPPRYFRPPYGVATPALAVALARCPLTVVGWSVRTHDGSGQGDAAERARWTVATAEPGDVILMHDAPEIPGGRMPLGPAMLPMVLTGLRDRGLKLVVLSDLVGKPLT
jgi:peptidoglycan-N-acetylglucosamine deacetylase